MYYFICLTPSVGEDLDREKHVFILPESKNKFEGNINYFFISVNEHINHRVRSNANKLHSADVLIFVHGYKSNLEKVVIRLAKLRKNLLFNGTVILCSWASMDLNMCYLVDRKRVNFTTKAFQKFINDITEKVSSFK